MAKIEKFILESLNYLTEVTKEDSYLVKVGKSNTHVFNERTLKFKKNSQKFSFEISTIIRSGVQREKELTVRSDSQIEFHNAYGKIFTKGKNLLINRISYPDIDSDSRIKEIGGELTEISSVEYSYYKRDRFYRMILPLNRKISFRGDFTGWHYSIDSKPMFETLLKLTILNIEYHLFLFSSESGKSYIAIDCIHKRQYKAFLLAPNSILLTYAFLKGDYHGEEATVFSYKSVDFKQPVSLRTIILGGGIYNGFPVHSTKPHSLVQLQAKFRYKKDKDGRVVGINDTDLKKYMVEFPSENFARLCELIITKGGILRSIILFVSNHSTTLEMKVPILFVALENVTKVMTGADKSTPKLITDENLITKIKSVIKVSVKEISKIGREHEQKPVSEADKKLYELTFLGL